MPQNKTQHTGNLFKSAKIRLKQKRQELPTSETAIEAKGERMILAGRLQNQQRKRVQMIHTETGAGSCPVRTAKKHPKAVGVQAATSTS